MKSIQQKILSHEAIFAADLLVSVAATAVSFGLTNYYSFFELGQRLGLPEICPIDEQGVMLDNCGFLAGKKTTDVVESEEIKQVETEVVANDVDLVETEEMPEDKDQINFDEVLAATPSPVEPEAPVLDQEDSAEDEVETPFNLFGGSALVFPSDISEDEEAPVDNDGNFKFRKKLKFGVDFDVKKDK